MEPVVCAPTGSVRCFVKKGKSTCLDYFRYENGLPEVQSGLIDFRAQCAHFTKITNFPCFSFPPSPSVFSSFGGFSLLRIFLFCACFSPTFSKISTRACPDCRACQTLIKNFNFARRLPPTKKTILPPTPGGLLFFPFPFHHPQNCCSSKNNNTCCQDPQSTGEDTHLHLHTLLRGTNRPTKSLLIHASAPGPTPAISEGESTHHILACFWCVKMDCWRSHLA